MLAPAALVDHRRVVPTTPERLWRWLGGMESACAARARAWRQREAGNRPRSGILFRVGAQSLLAAVDGLAEVLAMPRLVAGVPGTANWVVGVANHRGALLPLVDLGLLLAGQSSAVAGRGYVLVPRTSVPFGLCVDAVIGLRRYLPRDLDDPSGPRAAGSAWDMLVVGAGQDADEQLPVVDLTAVERLPSFGSSGREGVLSEQPLRVVILGSGDSP